MLTQLDTFGIDKPSRPYFTVYLRRMFFQEVPIIPFDKANFHAFTFFCLDSVSFVTQISAHLRFCIGTQREDTTLQHILPQPPKEIRLVFLVIVPGYDIHFAVYLLQTRIMPGSDILASQLVRPFRKDAELEHRIAHDTGVGCTALAIFINKILYYYPAESITFISNVMPNPHTFGKLACVNRFVSPHPHGKPHYFIALLFQHQTSGSAVYAATHTY